MIFANILALTVHAFVWVGNPTLHVEVDGDDLVSASATVETVTVVYCDDTTEEVGVDQAISLGSGVDVQVPGGDICAIDVLFDGTVSAAQQAAAGSASSPSVQVPVDSAGPHAADLTGFQITQGTWSGDEPVVVVTMP